MERVIIDNEKVDMKVLMADDSDIVRESLKKLLLPVKGISEIEEARDVAEAIEKLPLVRPDLLILDIRMPGGTGFDVLERVGQLDPKPLVIMLTNYPNEQYRKKGLSLGAEFFLDKSTEFEEIINVCKREIETKH